MIPNTTTYKELVQILKEKEKQGVGVSYETDTPIAN